METEVNAETEGDKSAESLNSRLWTTIVMEGFKETIEQALIGMRETLVKELGGGRRPSKRTKDGKPTAP